jgi:hypothetical protein
MDGDRKASAHEIVFQSRAGTPELNCCSVNGPRVPGMLADWAVMRNAGGLTVNWHGPAEIKTTDPQGRPVLLKCESNYPVDGRVTWSVQAEAPVTIRFRIPSWAAGAKAKYRGAVLAAEPNTYTSIAGTWQDTEPVVFDFQMPYRALKGEREQAGKVSIYRGPLLLAWDQADNDMDEFRIPRIDPAKLDGTFVAREPGKSLTTVDPWVLLEVPTASGSVRLRDYATAGMSGTRYRSWLRTVSAETGKKGGPPELRADLKTGPAPEAGRLVQSKGFSVAGESVKLNGTDGMLAYALPEGFGAGDFTVAVSVKVEALPEKRLGQIFSAWCASGDDPLRLVVQNGHVHARIENKAGSAGTGGVPLATGGWRHIAATKEGSVLTLFVDGVPCSSAEGPPVLQTQSKAGALGGNPLYTGAPEFLAAEFRNFAVYGRALADEEVAARAKAK